MGLLWPMNWEIAVSGGLSMSNTSNGNYLLLSIENVPLALAKCSQNSTRGGANVLHVLPGKSPSLRKVK